MTLTAESVTTEQRASFAAGLRELADWYDEHPDFPLPYYVKQGETIDLSIIEGVDADGFASLVRQLGGRREKDVSDRLVYVRREFGPLRLQVLANRDEVCEAVVVGTETVIEDEVVEPAVTRRVEKQRDVIEWRCAPVLEAG